jgi:flavin reductase (DIM6/NTAB) family NADH-FMN oxidoreductase RutF
MDYASDIMKALQKGVLLTTKAEGKVNTMTISWGQLGIEWNVPTFITFVREGRFTREQLDKNGEFTVNIPFGEFNKKILGFCGTRTGRDTDKVKEMNLTLVDGETVSVPAIKELRLTLECKVIYRQKQERELLRPEGWADKLYPLDVDSSFHGANKDIHVAYYGKIEKAYVIED